MHAIDLDFACNLLYLIIPASIGAFVDVFADKENYFKGLFFQDTSMKQCFSSYPEIVFLDATYKLLEIGLPTYLLLCEDSNGLSEIVFVCLLVTEDQESMQWMLETFKKNNENWSHIRIVMADKDIGERDIIKSNLPTASVLICLFHALRTFRREVSCEKLGITPGERLFCLEIFQKVAYASSEAEYQSLCKELYEGGPKQVKDYFKENWAPIENEWVLHSKAKCGSFLNSTNNRLESINGKLKQVINRNSSLEEFVDKFFVILSTLRSERDHRAAVMFQKVKVQNFGKGTPEYQYSQLLTAYASSYVSKQLKLIHKVKEIAETRNSGIYNVETSGGVKNVSLVDYDCLFRQSMLLPCRHMFALRKKLESPLYDESLCNARWTSTYYHDNQRIFLDMSPSGSDFVEVTQASKPNRVSCQHQKYRKAVVLTSELASIVSEASGVHFDRRINLVKELIQYWKSGEEVALTELDYGKSLYTLVCNGLKIRTLVLWPAIVPSACAFQSRSPLTVCVMCSKN